MTLIPTVLEKQPFSNSKLVGDFLREEEAVKRFYQNNSTSQKSKPRDRFACDRTWLQAYNSGIPFSEKQKKNLELLESGKAYTVVTGQQVVFGGGAAFTLYKALGAVALSERLSQKYGKPVVPVFWLADEDHDLEEVLDIPLLGRKQAKHPFKWNLTAGAASAHMKPSQAEMLSNLDALFDQIPETEFTSSLKLLLSRNYDNCSFGDGFRNLINSILGESGILFAGSNNINAKKLVSNQLASYIYNYFDIQSALEKVSSELSEVYHVQVHVGDVQLFHFDEKGVRSKIQLDDGKFLVGGASKEREDLISDIEKHPENYSPNALLRPVLQDVLLPNLAYVGGAAEVAYLAQTGPLYEALNVPRSEVFLRPSLTFLWGKEQKLFRDSEKDMVWFTRDVNALKKELALQSPASKVLDEIGAIQRKVHIQLDKVRKQLGAIEDTFQNTVKAADAKVARLFKHFEKKAMNGLKRREKIQIVRLIKVRELLYPNSKPQERSMGLIEILNEFGPEVVSAITDVIQEQWKQGNHILVEVEP